jgi:16S rRNA (uracil1498-N3)-methyltransferase
VEVFMNLILLKESDFTSDINRIVLKDRRFEHIKSILKPSKGDLLEVGVINGKMGEGRVLGISDTEVSLEVNLNKEPPEPINCKLVLAMPRPIVLKRLLVHITTLGIKDIYLMQTNRVEKSYWHSPVLKEDALNEYLELGLEQAKDTVLPRVHLKKRFKPFIEDELGNIIKGTNAYVAHPGMDSKVVSKTSAVTIAIGPEGGFVPYEIEKLQDIGFSGIHLGSRILKVETAIATCVGKVCL